MLERFFAWILYTFLIPCVSVCLSVCPCRGSVIACENTLLGQIGRDKRNNIQLSYARTPPLACSPPPLGYNRANYDPRSQFDKAKFRPI